MFGFSLPWGMYSLTMDHYIDDFRWDVCYDEVSLWYHTKVFDRDITLANVLFEIQRMIWQSLFHLLCHAKETRAMGSGEFADAGGSTSFGESLSHYWWGWQPWWREWFGYKCLGTPIFLLTFLSSKLIWEASLFNVKEFILLLNDTIYLQHPGNAETPVVILLW